MSELQQGIQACCDGRGLNAVRLRRLFTLLAKDLFTDPENIDEYSEQLACLKHDVNFPSGGDLYVGPTHTKQSAEGDPSAGVYVSVRQVHLDKKFLGNRWGRSPDGATVLLGKQARAHVRLRSKHPDVDIALMMGESLLVYLSALQPILTEFVPGLLSYDVVEMTEAELEKAKPENRYTVDVSVRVEYQLVVAVTQESHKLKKFGFAVNAQ